MGLFRRKTTTEDDGERCPRCAERVPDGANECAMCGIDLRPLRSSTRVTEEAKARASTTG
jgi:hypothetical protein